MHIIFRRPHESNSLIKNFFYKTFGVPHVGMRVRGRAVLSVFPQKTSLRILDVGSGATYFSYELQKRGHHVTSLDSLRGVSEGDIEKFKTIFKKGGQTLHFVEGNATHLPFPKESFDAIIIADVIEHIEDEDKVMKEMHRVLKPGGFFIASTPTLGFHSGRFKRFFRFLHQHTFLKRLPLWDTVQLYPKSHMKSEGHVREYSLQHWKNLCARHHFRLRDWTYEYKFFGAFFVELYHTFTFVDRYGNYLFPFMYPFTFIDSLLPIKGTGIALVAYKL